jgi:sulfatase maturation enzyme AslB (radical SAM superfamily)
MQIIYNTAKPFDKLLKKQKPKAGATYRPMYYVVEQPVDEGLLLYHTMTKAFLLLTPEEAEIYKTHPADLQQLIDLWFLVPEDHDDRLLARQIRNVAKMIAKPVNAITHYTIMTTTDCNARCFYCFEMGQPRIPMSDEMARRIADYIIKHSNGEKVSITWYGGDPLYNKGVISIISQLLKDAGIDYKSNMISNGYLFDEETITEARELWLMRQVQITLDGTEQVYNKNKAFIYKNTNAYQRVISNIHKLQDAGIIVIIRLNIDMHNADNLLELTEELHHEFPNTDGIHVYVHQLFEEKKGRTAIHNEQKRRIVFLKMKEIRNRLSDYGFSKKIKLRKKVKINRCMADNDRCITITPIGNIGKCDHYTNDQFVSHIYSKVWDEEMMQSFRETIDEIPACTTCFDYPNCFMLKRCQATKRCYPEVCEDKKDNIHHEMLVAYSNYKNKNMEEEDDELHN